MTESQNQASAPTQAAIVRANIWFDDGNIILIVPVGPGNYTAFKVHRGQLERHSEVFQSLFSVPQPIASELIEGCPFVELHDCPSDLFYLLSALYDGLYFKKAHANDFTAISAVLRLSTKYFIDHLRRRCMHRLNMDWPSSLKAWDAREKDAVDAQGRYSPRDACAHPILVIHLALELGLESLLPAAFYDLSRYGPSKIYLGAAPSPGTHLHLSQAKPPSVATPLVRLSAAHFCQTLLGREMAQAHLAAFIEHELTDRPAARDCSFYFIRLNILRAVGGIACGRDGDPLYTLLQALEMLSRTDFTDGVQQCGLKMCHVCKADFAGAVGRAREEVWGMIPGWFGLVGAGGA
ncbi:hypothetical protein FIBSPDRAFT_912810 [Athelia psychrophila]|uniref:BTB domain-containing protein n=1 Tax=Athelia psychrophila TaxID=1759441 RepID=A0A166D735_9AGAM|nr:hypothetical protein FIBSPDRAFT_912810 [Fibularhizoctonia sp. CBS 109695]